MLVAVACDLGSEEHRTKVHGALLEYGFKKLQENLYESTSINERNLQRLKRELDGVTDSYDKLRFYQFPIGDTLVVTSLAEKKWRKLVVTVQGKGI